MRQPPINRAAIYVKATAGNSREGAERSTQMDEAEQFCKERGLHVTARYSDDQRDWSRVGPDRDHVCQARLSSATLPPLPPFDRSARMYSRCRSFRLGRRPGNRPSARAFACPATERSTSDTMKVEG